MQLLLSTTGSRADVDAPVGASDGGVLCRQLIA